MGRAHPRKFKLNSSVLDTPASLIGSELPQPLRAGLRPFVADRNIRHFLWYGGVAGDGLRSVGEEALPHPRACALSCPSPFAGRSSHTSQGTGLRPFSLCPSQRMGERGVGAPPSPSSLVWKHTSSVKKSPIWARNHPFWVFAPAHPGTTISSSLSRAPLIPLEEPPGFSLALPRPDALSPPPSWPLRWAHNTRGYGHPLFGVPG